MKRLFQPRKTIQGFSLHTIAALLLILPSLSWGNFGPLLEAKKELASESALELSLDAVLHPAGVDIGILRLSSSFDFKAAPLRLNTSAIAFQSGCFFASLQAKILSKLHSESAPIAPTAVHIPSIVLRL